MLSPTKLIGPVIALGIFAGCVIVLVRQPKPAVPASEVVARIRETALRRTKEERAEDGGPVGPWWVAAEGVDEAGRLLKFRLIGGSFRVAARSARLVVDPIDDTFSFELHDVVITKLPTGDEDGESTVHALEHHVLGPVDWGRDIETDAVEAIAAAADP